MSETVTGTNAGAPPRRSLSDRLEGLAMTAPPRRARGPVFIGDAVTAWGGRPVLLLLDEPRAEGD